MKTKIILASTAALLLVGTAATVAVAQKATNKGMRGDHELTADNVLEGAERMFNLIDANNDGVLSQEEIDAGPQRPGRRGLDMDDLPLNAEDAQAKLAETFAAMDTDVDGEVTAAERAAYRAAQLAEAGVAAKGVTLEEFTERGMRPFNLIDTNDDGEVSEEEALAMKAAREEFAGGRKGKGMGQKAGKRGMKGHGHMGGGRGGQSGKRLVKAFLGEDGLTAGMTWDDLQAKVTEAFNGLDADQSGTLTRDEIMPVMKEMFGDRKGGKRGADTSDA